MLPHKKAISQQINTAIRKNWSKECSEILDQLVTDGNSEALDLAVDKNYPIQNANTVALSRLKERVDALEDLTDHLFYYVCFLVENLPELITKTIKTSYDPAGEIECFREPELNEEKNPDPSRKPALPTRREHDVLELLEKGYCAKEIARKLFISESTVITHKKNLKKKFNARNTAELIFKIKNRAANKIVRMNFLDQAQL